LALCALVILVLTVFACENPFIPGKYKEPAPPQAPSISIAASPIGPYIKGEGLTMTASAKVSDGGELSYQWYSNNKNSSSGGNKISGATGESYRPSTDIEGTLDTKYYYVEATNTLYGRTTKAASRTLDVTVYDVGTDIAIREVNVTVVAPVKGASPSDVVSTEAGYTLVDMEWDPWTLYFQERHQYTVTVKIQAENGYTLIALRTAKINGHAAEIKRIDGNIVELSVKFAEMKGVEAMEVKTQPTNMDYTHGNALDLSGLVVTVTYSDGTTDDVGVAEFAERDIITIPAHDSAVSYTSHNGNPVVVSHAGVTAPTANLNVSKAVITDPDVYVVGPLRGETPQTTANVDSSQNYIAGNVSWTPAPVNNEFQGGIQYTATVTLTVKSGDYIFASGSDLSAKISGIPATVSTNNQTSITVSYQFVATLDKVITAIAVTNQPSILTYTHGQTLSLDGLEVTVTYEGDPNPEVLPFAQFQSKNMTTNPADGVTLTRAYPLNHNGTTVVVSIGSLYVNTDQLTVNPKELTITGVAHGKTYDGNTTVTGGVTGVTFTGTIGNDNAQVSVINSSVNAVYNNADAGSTMRINGLTLTGSAANNYNVTTPVLAVTATPGITKRNTTMNSWPIASVASGAALSTAQFSTTILGYSAPTGLNGATVTGTYTFNSPGTTVALASSGSSYAATFTPDSANYNSATGNIVVTIRSTSTSSVAMEMVYMPAGSVTVIYWYNRFGPGDVDWNKVRYWEEYSRTANLSAFYIGKYEVTQAQYQAVMGTNPSSGSSNATAGETQNRRPVENVTWYDAVEFCNKLSTLEGLQTVYTVSGRTPATGYPITSMTVTMDMSRNGYRLPTEMEWNYAGADTYPVTPVAQRETYAWYQPNSSSRTHQVGLKLGNRKGLYDIVGNVQEWCFDTFSHIPAGGNASDPFNNNASESALRICRGVRYDVRDTWESSNGWNTREFFEYPAGRTANYFMTTVAFIATYDNEYNCRAPDTRASNTGFRVVRR